MLDRTIPFYNTILKCSDYRHKEIVLPEGYSIVSYRPGFEKDWARLEFSIGDFGSLEEAEQYFADTYLQNPEMFSRILFALDKDNDVAGSCIAWQDPKGECPAPSLHWLVVDEKHQGIGLGRALSTAVMNIYAGQGSLPVYIHTQPWSWKAILLYLSLGFKLQKTDTFSHYENEYDKAMTSLGKVVSEEQYELMQQQSEN